MNNDDLVSWTCKDDVPTTSLAIERFLSSAGVKVFAVIDQQSHATAAGLSMEPLTEILFGNPRAGTPLMKSNPLTAFDLPIKVLVTTSGSGGSVVKMLSPHAFANRYGCNSNTANDVLGDAAKLIGRALGDAD